MGGFLFWFVLALLGWLLMGLLVGYLVGRMFGAGTQSVFEEPERDEDWLWPRRPT